eukprot:scaffold1637_cov195-Alexandrium_tamarense.AAC.13
MATTSPLQPQQSPHQPQQPSGMLREREVVRNTGKQAIGTFLDSQNCYSVLRNSGKVVVFDTRIPIQLAFYALVEHVWVYRDGWLIYQWGYAVVTLNNATPNTGADSSKRR